jgi:hypothetical protein
VLDLLPVLGYVWQVAWAFHQPETLEVEAWVSARLAPVWRGRSTPVAVGLRRRATARRLPEAQRAPVEPWAHDLCLYPDCWHDDAYLATSCSVATQGIEGACRPLVKERMAVTGARWWLTGVEAVLRRRSLWTSGAVATYGQFHLQQAFQCHHATGYANGTMPMPQPALT